MMKSGFLLFVICLTLIGCGKEENTESVETADFALTSEDTKEMYHFVDVYGNGYDAELLEDVPKSAYNPERLIEEDGYKYYTDENGEVMSKIGIDVSKFQQEVDFQAVKDAGMDFVIIRLGFRGYGEEGRIVEDEMFASNIQKALDAGLEVGVYFFSQALDEKETLEEAQFVLERIKDYEITGPVVFDTEEIKGDAARTDNLEKKQFTDNCITFCDAVKEAGYDTMIYANMKWMAFTLDLERLTEYEKWYADYEPHPQCPYEFSMWQYTEEGSVPGVEGNVDINVWFE